jgi:hypothetical protein
MKQDNAKMLGSLYAQLRIAKKGKGDKALIEKIHSKIKSIKNN